MPFHQEIFDFFGELGDVVTDLIAGNDVVDDFMLRFQQRDSGGGGNGAVIPRENGTSVVTGAGMQGGCQITMPIQSRHVAYCQPGYVAVDTNGDGITDQCMLKEVAKACGLWKSRPKAILTASDRRSLNRATSVMRKVDTVVKQTNELRGQAKLTKARPTRRK